MSSVTRNVRFVLIGIALLLAVVFGPLRQSGTVELGSSLPRASITVDARAAGPPISPYLYGVAVEWIDNGNVILDPKTRLLRPDLVDPLKALRIPVWRFPGGILADHYHWRDGVGPPEGRPIGRNPMDDTEHVHAFGTDEFIALCRATGAAALITANAGTGTQDEALAWQAHFAAEKFPVRYWEIGNEIYLAEDNDRPSIPGNDRTIFKTPDAYARLYVAWRAALRARDPAALAGAIAGTANTSAQNRGWLPTLLSTTAGEIDFIALHDAFAPLILDPYDYGDRDNRRAAYASMFARVQWTGEDIAEVKSRWTTARAGATTRIAITEHFPLFGGGGDQQQVRAILDQSRTLAAALYTASLFHEFMRREVWMANYNIATGKWFGALLTDTESGIIKTPTYHVFDLYRNHFGTKMVGATVHGPHFETRQVGTVPARKAVPYLDVAASKDGTGGVYLAVINRSGDQPVDTDIHIAGTVSVDAAVMTLAGPLLEAINGPALGSTVQPNANIAILTSTWNMRSGSNYRFPPASVTVFRWSM